MTQPDDRQQLTAVARKPTVSEIVGGAGLSSHSGYIQIPFCRAGCAGSDHLSQSVIEEISGSRIHHLFNIEWIAALQLSATLPHVSDSLQRLEESARGKGMVQGCYSQRLHYTGT